MLHIGRAKRSHPKITQHKLAQTKFTMNFSNNYPEGLLTTYQLL